MKTHFERRKSLMAEERYEEVEELNANFQKLINDVQAGNMSSEDVANRLLTLSNDMNEVLELMLKITRLEEEKTSLNRKINDQLKKQISLQEERITLLELILRMRKSSD